MNGDGRIVGYAHGVLHGAAYTDLADIGVSGVVVHVQDIAGLQEGFTVLGEVYADVFLLFRVGDIRAGDVCYGEHAGLEAVCIFDGLAHGHTVVEAETAGERSAHLALDGNLVHVTEGGEAEYADLVLCLQREVVTLGILFREREGEDLNGLVRTRTLHVHKVQTGAVAGAAGKFDCLAKGHYVVEAEGALEGVTDFSAHAHGPFLKVTVKCKDGHHIPLLQLEIRVAVFSGERNGEDLNGLVGGGALHKDIVLAGGILEFRFLDEALQALVLVVVEIAAVVDVTLDGHKVLKRACGRFDPHYVAGLQGNLLVSAHNGLEFIFLVTDLTVHMTLNLDKLRIYVVGKAAGVLDEFCKVFSLNHLIPHRTLYAAFNGNYLLGDRNKEDVVVLEVIGKARGGICHILVKVQTGGLTGTGELDVTDGTLSGGAACRGKGVEGGVEGAEGETALYANLTEDAHRDGTGCGDGNGNLVRAERIVMGQFAADGCAGLGKCHSLEEDLGGACGLDGAVRGYPLVDFSLG